MATEHDIPKLTGLETLHKPTLETPSALQAPEYQAEGQQFISWHQAHSAYEVDKSAPTRHKWPHQRQARSISL